MRILRAIGDALRGIVDALSRAVEHLGRVGDSVSIRRPDILKQRTLCRCPNCGLTQLVNLAQRCPGRVEAEDGRTLECEMVVVTDLHAVGPVESYHTEGPAIVPRLP